MCQHQGTFTLSVQLLSLLYILVNQVDCAGEILRIQLIILCYCTSSCSEAVLTLS